MPHSVEDKQPENRWSPEEDRILLSAIKQCGPVIIWSQVSACLPGRNSKSCRKRWVRSLDPTLRKGRWTEEEDSLLTTAVEIYGTQWFQVAKMLHGRTDDQCAKRWRENLDPSISRMPWTKEDDELLMKTYEKIGRRWKDLASHFEGRPPVHCRNRVQSLVRARRRAAAAVRKVAQAKPRGKSAADKEVVTTELDWNGGENDMSVPPDEDFVSSGGFGDALPPTPSSYVSDLDQTTQQLHCTAFVPPPIHEVGENFPISSTSDQPFVSAYHPGSYIPHESSYSQPSTSHSFGTPPQPHLTRSDLPRDLEYDASQGPQIHGENSWSVLTPQQPAPTFFDRGLISPEWNASCSCPHFEQVSRSRFPQACAGVLISTPADSCHPRDDTWWPQGSTLAYSGRFSHRAHYPQVFDSPFPNYFTSPMVQGFNDSELLYPPLLPSLLTTSLV